MISRFKQLSQMNPRSYLVALASNYAVMVVAALVQLILVPVYLNTIGTEGFGAATMIFSMVHVASVGLIWIDGGSARVMAEHAAHEEWSEASNAYSLAGSIYIIYGCFVAALFMATVAAVDSPLFLFPEKMDAEAVWILALSVSLYIVLQYDFNFQLLAYQAAKYHWVGNLLQIFNSVFFFILAVPALMLFGELYWVFICMVLSTLCTRWASWFGWRYTARRGAEIRYRFPNRSSMPLFRRLIGRMGVKYAIYGLLARAGQMDAMLVGWLGGTQAAGLYALLVKIPYLCVQVIWRIASTAEPYFIHCDSRGEHQRLVQIYHKGQLITAAASLAMGLGFALFGHWVLAFWVGETNIPQAHEAYWLAGMMIVWIGATRWPVRCAYALLKLRSLCIVTFFESAAKVSLIILMFDSVNYLAPVWAINIEFIFGVLFLYIWLGRQLATKDVKA
ncbi:hypothetical protein [Mariprofundus sp. KV]|uniref:lipopolysaccharide biosynthesis protein n=1 Tax=Mariprofundus sp. KV TaxID=2608715 RepID=UPI0015A032D3|nr:hypothetical protein [Mariprofundus sp. KV]NWF35537.1 hypothetical protein [Mariprofundus sp. KV]